MTCSHVLIFVSAKAEFRTRTPLGSVTFGLPETASVIIRYYFSAL